MGPSVWTARVFRRWDPFVSYVHYTICRLKRGLIFLIWKTITEHQRWKDESLREGIMRGGLHPTWTFRVTVQKPQTGRVGIHPPFIVLGSKGEKSSDLFHDVR